MSATLSLRATLRASLRFTCRPTVGVVPTFPTANTHPLLQTHTRPTSTSTPPHPPPTSMPPPSSATRHLPLVLALLTAAAAATYLSRSSSPSSELSPTHFTQLKIAAIRRLTPDTAIFSFEIPPGMTIDVQGLGGLTQAECVVSVWLKQPDLQIQRAYTPLEADVFFRAGEGKLELLVKRYADGELSRWLHRLNVGDEVGVRGGVLTWATPQVCDEVVFVVGGTGITPAYQFLRSALAPPATAASTPTSAPPKITILYSSPTPTSIFLKPELDALAAQHPSRVSIRYLVDRDDGPPPAPASSGWGMWGAQSTSPKLHAREDGVLVGRAGVGELGEWLGRRTGSDKAGQKRVVVVCGPEGMVNAVAGPRARDMSQGPIGGMLGELGYGRGEVVKL